MPKPEKDEARRQLEEAYANLLKPLIDQVEAAFPAYQPQISGTQGGVWGKPHRRYVTFIFAAEAQRVEAETNGDTARIKTMLVDLVTKLNRTLFDKKPIELGVDFADMDAINAAGGFYNFFK
jgi:hypothetical protein